MRRLLIILAFVFSTLFSFSQSEDSTNVKSYYSDLNLKFLVNNKFNNLQIQNDNLKDELAWKTNDNNLIGLGFNYKWLGLNVLFNLPSINRDEDIYGETLSLNLGSNIYTKSFGLDLWIQESKGLYLDKPNTWFPAWRDTIPYPQNRNLQISSIGANFIYVLDHDQYSLKASFIQNERQLVSAGSPVFGAYITAFEIETDSSILPFTPVNAIDSQLDIRNSAYLNLGSFAGYSHTFVFQEYLFISLTGVLGLALQGSDIETFSGEYEDEEKQIFTGKFHGRAALGYNTDDYFGSLALIIDSNSLGKSYRYNFGFVRFTFGLRFNTKKVRS